MYLISFMYNQTNTCSVVNMEQRLESSATFPMWLSSSLKSREKYCNHSISSGMSKLNVDPQITSSPSTSPTNTPEEHFKHENHSQHILSKMSQYYASGKLKDVTLIAGKFFNNLIFMKSKEITLFNYFTGEKRIEAHRIVLSAASDYFAAMFTNDFGESFQNEVELQAVDPDALETLVAYCYSGTVTCCFYKYSCPGEIQYFFNGRYCRGSRIGRRYCGISDGNSLLTSTAGSCGSLFHVPDSSTPSVQLSRYPFVCGHTKLHSFTSSSS